MHTKVVAKKSDRYINYLDCANHFLIYTHDKLSCCMP